MIEGKHFKKVDLVTITRSSSQTVELGKKFAKYLSPGDIVCLIGDLGTGKTTFVQGLAKGLGISEPVKSPSFVLVKYYGLLCHIDLYRVNIIEAMDLFQEYSSNIEECVTAIEWAEKIIPYFQSEKYHGKYIELNFTWYGMNRRKIIFKNYYFTA